MIAGHENGDVSIYDFKQQKLLKTLKTGSNPIVSLCFINNGLNLLVGSTSGFIKLYELKTYQEQAEVLNAHLPKGGDGVNCMIELQDQDMKSGLPFFISGGSDNNVKIFEHNLY